METEVIGKIMEGAGGVGLGSGILIAVVLFLRYLGKRDDSCVECRKATQTLVENHLTHSTNILGQVMESMDNVAKILVRLEGRLNGDKKG